MSAHFCPLCHIHIPMLRHWDGPNPQWGRILSGCSGSFSIVTFQGLEGPRSPAAVGPARRLRPSAHGVRGGTGVCIWPLCSNSSWFRVCFASSLNLKGLKHLESVVFASGQATYELAENGCHSRSLCHPIPPTPNSTSAGLELPTTPCKHGGLCFPTQPLAKHSRLRVIQSKVIQWGVPVRI